MQRRKLLAKAFRPALVEACENRRLLAFGLTTTTTAYNIDTGAGVTFSILRGGSLSSTVHLGDMTSFKLNGVEFAAPFSVAQRYSHFESGLSSGAVLTATVDPSPTPQWIKITCDDTTATVGTGMTGVIQYYIARRNDPVIYMATYAPEMLVSSTRYITYLDGTKFPYRAAESDNSGNTGAIESGDVFGYPDGTTTSKYYGETRSIDHLYHGATGPSAGAFMYVGNRERGASGPFWKDIDFQSGSSVELYNMPYSGHSLIDAFRPGLHGPYALVLSNGTAPQSTPDYTFLDGVGLTGWISPSARGAISGRVSGIGSGKISTVALSNAGAQYWDTPDAAGNYSINGVIPGTYTETLYEEELAVGTRTVTITVGQTTRADIAAAAWYGLNGADNTFIAFNNSATPIWRIGTWDGTPREFKNADKITIMHPQDSRLQPWATDATGTTNYTIGTSTSKDWPMAEWKTQVGAAPYVDTKNRITFNLTAAQAALALTLRIGITRSDSERPGASANGGTTQFGVIVSQAAARGVSLGSWRGNNSIYAYNFNPGTFVAGTNTIDIYAVSGSTFTGYFSGYHIYDAVDLIPRYVTGTTSNTTAPVITSLNVSPGASTNIGVLGSRQFSVTGNSISGIRAVNAVWTATRGTINDAGEYVAPATAGTDTITATVGSVVSSVIVNITNTAPTIAAAAVAATPITYTNSTALSVLGADDAGEAGLTYTWSAVGTPPGPVTFGATNGTNAGKSLTATFTTFGTYTLQALITDASGNTTVSQTTVVVKNEKALYKFDMPNGAAITDFSGNGNTGTVYGDVDYPEGLSGTGAIRFYGGAGTLPNGVVAGLDDFTIATWVKADSITAWARVFDFGNDTNNYMFLSARAGVAGNPIRFAITNAGGAAEQRVDGPSLALNTWTHLAISLSGNTATLYVNGVAVATNSGITLRPSSLGTTTRNYLAESQFAADPTFMGTIEDFRIYGRALSTTEINQLARPTLVNPAAAAGATITTATANLSTLGADQIGGESSLTYTWKSIGTPPAPVSFSINGTNAAKNTVATFTAPGTYSFRATITASNGQTVWSEMTVTVVATLTSLVVTPNPVTVAGGTTQSFTATGRDQFGQAIALTGTPTWSLIGGAGSISASGLYTAPLNGGGSATVGASLGIATGVANITVSDVTPPAITSASFAYEFGQSITTNLSEAVLGFTVDDLTITNLTTSQVIPSNTFTMLVVGGTVVTFNRDIAAFGALPNGDYRVTIGAGSFADASGNALASGFSLDFFVLAGDVNRDRAVNFDDLLVIAQNYGQTGNSFSQGNIDYSSDGSVGFDDLLLLAQQYGTSLLSRPASASRARRSWSDTLIG